MQQTQLLLSVSFIKYDFAELPTNNLFKFNEVLTFWGVKIFMENFKPYSSWTQKRSPVGFSAANSYVYALWPWNFLTFNIHLFDTLGQILVLGDSS